MGHKIVWFDIPVHDLERASNFYRQVLAVDIEIYGGEVPVAVMEHGPGDVAGCLFRNESDEPSLQGPLLYFTVEGRLEQATGLVEEHGGKILQAPHSIGPHGNRSIVSDSEGNRIALHSESTEKMG
jgi:hypothetical protein